METRLRGAEPTQNVENDACVSPEGDNIALISPPGKPLLRAMAGQTAIGVDARTMWRQYRQLKFCLPRGFLANAGVLGLARVLRGLPMIDFGHAISERIAHGADRTREFAEHAACAARAARISNDEHRRILVLFKYGGRAQNVSFIDYVVGLGHYSLRFYVFGQAKVAPEGNADQRRFVCVS
ncbi:hypothetical protein [Caballeronia calidae]|uniref:hypothetical protein n=1 Tax=Caballeronia calidae TaxID=1777139 RepID=UPI0018DFCC2C|nr:hypothetical protein [Caballeronia calidae]